MLTITFLPLFFNNQATARVGALFNRVNTLAFLISYLLLVLFLSVKRAQIHKGALAKFS